MDDDEFEMGGGAELAQVMGRLEQRTNRPHRQRQWLCERDDAAPSCKQSSADARSRTC